MSDEKERRARPFRVLPAVTPDNAHFWLGGAEGELRLLQCKGCGHWIHPPAPVCPACLGRELAVAAASGRATVHTFTVNWQPWYPNLDPPYVVAIVELPEQPGLRLTTNVVGCEPDDVRIGMEVEVVFEEHEEVFGHQAEHGPGAAGGGRSGVWLPLFHPVAGGATGGGAGGPVE